jgi:biopolymer transport protein ExbD
MRHTAGVGMTAIVALLAVLSADPSAGAPHVRILADSSGKCVTIWNGQTVDNEALLDRARTVSDEDKKRGIHIDGKVDAPYRCIGGVIYTLQAAGFTKIGFISEPPPRRVVVEVDRRCRLKLDGRRITLDVLRARSSAWGAEGADVHFRASSSATYQCVAPIEKIIADAGVGKIAFIGGSGAPSEGTSK